MTRFVSTQAGYINFDRVVRIDSANEQGLYTVHYLDERGQPQKTLASEVLGELPQVEPIKPTTAD